MCDSVNKRCKRSVRLVSSPERPEASARRTVMNEKSARSCVILINGINRYASAIITRKGKTAEKRDSNETKIRKRNRGRAFLTSPRHLFIAAPALRAFISIPIFQCGKMSQIANLFKLLRSPPLRLRGRIKWRKKVTIRQKPSKTFKHVFK